MWSVCRRNSLVLLSSNLKKRRMSSNLSADMVALYIGFEKSFPNNSRVDTAFLSQQEVQAQNKLEVLP